MKIKLKKMIKFLNLNVILLSENFKLEKAEKLF